MSWEQTEVFVDLFSHMFHFSAPRLMACSSPGRGAVRWVGLSAPVVALSCAALFICSDWCVHPAWRSAVSILPEPLIEERPPGSAGHRPQCSERGAGRRWRASLPPPFFDKTSSRTSYRGRLTTRRLNARSNQGLLGFYTVDVNNCCNCVFLLRFHI